MKTILKALGSASKRAGAAIAALYRRYPARANSYIAAALVAAAGALGVVISPENALQVIEIVIPVLLGGEATHRLVSPAK
jgi:hypothetical protein